MKEVDDDTRVFNFTRGDKFFELSNHLGNVLATINDKKVQVDDGTYAHNSSTGLLEKVNGTLDGVLDYYNADVVTANDYYPFGMEMPGRKFVQVGKSYRYSINGQEKDSELNENTTTAEYWEYDSRIARRWNADPVIKEWESPYLCFSGNPIFYADPDGMDPEDPKGKTLPEVVVVAKIPKEGTRRINPKILQTPTLNDLKNSLSDFFTVTPSSIKPPEQKETDNPFQVYHRESKYFERGWYDADVYNLTTYDWDNGQVMGERNWLDKLATQTEFNDYTPVRGNLGGRDWNGWQVDDRGYLTGNLFGGPSVLKSGVNPIRIIRDSYRFLSTLGRVMRSAGSRTRLLGRIQNKKLRNLTNDLYQPNAKVGDGSSMSAFRFEQATGLLVGGKTHAIKLLNYRTALTKIWKARANLNSFDKRITKELLKDIQNALQGN